MCHLSCTECNDDSFLKEKPKVKKGNMTAKEVIDADWDGDHIFSAALFAIQNEVASNLRIIKMAPNQKKEWNAENKELCSAFVLLLGWVD